MGLKKIEKETIISFNEAEDTATVFTYRKSWQKKLESRGAKCTSTNSFGGKQYEIPKRWVRIPLPPRAGRKPTKRQLQALDRANEEKRAVSRRRKMVSKVKA